MRMLLLLSVLVVLTTGCATVDLPPVGSQLRDYNPEERIEVGPGHVLPTFTVEPVDNMLCTADVMAFEVYIHAAEANSEALKACSRTVGHLEDESSYLLHAGRAAEREAELFRQFAIDTGNQCRWVTAGALGAGGFLALVLGIGSL